MRTLAILCLTASAIYGQAIDRAKAPQTPPIPGYKMPPVAESKLPNGMTVISVVDTRFPLVTARLTFQAGSKLDPADSPGLSEAVAGLLTEGTKARTSRQISDETGLIGGTLGASSGQDGFTVSGSTLSENLSRLLALMADCAMNASFPPDEVSLYQQNRIQGLLAERSQPSFLANEKMAQLVFGSSPYAHIAPTEAAIKKLDPKLLTSFRETYLVPNNATLILIGKLPSRDTFNKMVTAEFGAWKQKALPPAPKIDVPAAKRQIVLVDRPGSVQADIHVGRLAPVRTSSEFFPLMVGTNILGGGASSRMFKNIREKEGFAYDAHTEYRTNRQAAGFQAVTQVRNDVLEPAFKALITELEAISAKPVPGEELASVKNHMAGLYLLRLETQDGVAEQLNNIAVQELPKDYLETYVTKVRSVEPDQLLSVAKKYIAPGQSAVVVVGDASKIVEVLKKFGEVTVAKAN